MEIFLPIYMNTVWPTISAHFGSTAYPSWYINGRWSVVFQLAYLLWGTSALLQLIHDKYNKNVLYMSSLLCYKHINVASHWYRDNALYLLVLSVGEHLGGGCRGLVHQSLLLRPLLLQRGHQVTLKGIVHWKCIFGWTPDKKFSMYICAYITYTV
mgnify:CR=1 FL=1